METPTVAYSRNWNLLSEPQHKDNIEKRDVKSPQHVDSLEETHVKSPQIPDHSHTYPLPQKEKPDTKIQKPHENSSIYFSAQYVHNLMEKTKLKSSEENDYSCILCPPQAKVSLEKIEVKSINIQDSLTTNHPPKRAGNMEAIAMNSMWLHSDV